MASQITLRHVLTQPKLPVPCTLQGGRNSAWKSWPDVRNQITIWDDFSLQTLNESYGHVLDSAFPREHITIPRSDEASARVVIEKLQDVNHLIGRNDRMMQPTLNLAKTVLRLRPGVSLQFAHSTTADQPTSAGLPNVSSQARVDHVIALDDFPLPTLVVGLGRPSSMWSGTALLSHLQRDKMPLELIWPLRQLANICKLGQTRYGYIQTDREMVVCCFSYSESLGPDKPKVAIMPIPWSRCGVDALTTDLALWWLCMLAMSPHQDRSIVRDEGMVRINEWHVLYVNEVQGWRRRHRYSNYEEPTANDWHNLDAGIDAVLASLPLYSPENI